MYKDQKRRQDTNGYIIVYIPDHHKAMKSGVFQGYVYEHVLMAEEILDRPIREGEVIHHLDENRSNNSPDNLLPLSHPAHSKIHGWINRNIITPTKEQEIRNARGCVRCKVCEKPIHPDLQCCSFECNSIYQSDNRQKISGVLKPTKEILENEIINTPMTELGIKYSVSDRTIRNWCITYGIELQNRRGYWTKVKHGVS